MKEFKNLDNKRVCDVSADERIAEIRLKDCVTKITVSPDGKLCLTNYRIEAAS